ncbi:hypothetical protein TNCV_539621 [Trichonephila clavipes]|nr:hypothetical protein TNCV_539621 [Trichonephila clavipes]
MSATIRRLLWGGVPQRKKVGGVTGIVHAVSMSRLYDGHPRAEEEAIKITVPYQSVLAGHEMQGWYTRKTSRGRQKKFSSSPKSWDAI